MTINFKTMDNQRSLDKKEMQLNLCNIILF